MENVLPVKCRQTDCEEETMNQYIHTPEGVRDIYGREYAARLQVRRQIRTTFHRFGYQDIQTPSFEFFDIFSKEKGSAASRELFKFFDRDGETLVLRPDMTPAIARCAAKYFSEEQMPLRLSYIENTFINRNSLQGRLKEFTQAGVEFLGDASPDADAEILALTIECLLASGLRDFQLEVGHVGFLEGLFEEAALSGETEETVRELLENKNYFGVEEQISRNGVKSNLQELFARLPELFGSVEQITAATALVDNAKSQAAIERLRQVYKVLCCYGLEKYVSFDLGMVGRYRYYNGMIFKGYTYGSGEPVVTGGRYDNLTVQFGRKSSAVGFAIVLDSVMAALSRQKIALSCEWPQILLVYTDAQRADAIARACCLRAEGRMVQLQRIGEEDSLIGEKTFASLRKYAYTQGFEKLYCLTDEGSLKEIALCAGEKCADAYAESTEANTDRQEVTR